MRRKNAKMDMPPSLPSTVPLLAIQQRGGADIGDSVVPLPTTATTRKDGRKQQSAQRKRHQRIAALIGLLFVLPSVLGFLLYNLGPILFGLYISFTKYTGFGSPTWTGWYNYLFLLHDADFWHALLETILLALFIVPLGIIVPLLLALLLNEGLPLQGLLRVLFFLPSAVPWVAAAFVFQDLFNHYGLYNTVLGYFHISPQDWTYATSSSSNLLNPLFWLIVILSVWKSYGLGMLIYLAGLQGIPKERYEAAMIDGAGPWQRFRSITLPGLAPVTFFVLITSFIGALQTFTPVYLLGQGAAQTVNGAVSGGGMQTVAVYAYNTAFQAGIYGYGSTILWGLFVLMFAFTLVQFRILQRGTRRKEALG